MNLQPVAVEQRINLSDGTIESFLVIVLPSGKETRAEVDSATVQGLLDELTAAHTKAKPEKTPVPQEPVEVPAQEPEVPDVPVTWSELAEDQLSSMMKTALRSLGVADPIPLSRLLSVIEQITERYTEDDWNNVKAILAQESLSTAGASAPPTPPPAVAPSRPPAAAPPIGQVIWADGSPIAPSAAAPMRTVPKDEKGYPITGNGEVDPGAVVGGAGTDEDGVGSI